MMKKLRTHRRMQKTTLARKIRFALVLQAVLLPAATSFAQQPRVGVVAPQTGEYAILGEQIRAGAQLEAESAGITLVPVTESCEDGGGNETGARLVEAGVDIAIGFLCGSTLQGAMPMLKQADIPALTLSVRSMPLMADARDAGWPLFRMTGSEQDQTDAIVDVIMSEWVDRPVALIDDGTIYYRELVNAVRNAIEARGLKPVLVDTFRPAQGQQLSLVRRLQQAGATHVLFGGSRSDAAIVARDAANEGFEITLMGGDALNAAATEVPLQNGVLAVGIPEYGRLPPAAAIAERAEADDIVPEGYVVPAAAAVAIAADAMTEAGKNGNRLEDILLSTRFDTPLGSVSFADTHELADNPFMLLRWYDDAFVPVFDSGQ